MEAIRGVGVRIGADSTFNSRAEPLGIEFPGIVQIETRSQLTGAVSVRRFRSQPLGDVSAFAPGLQRSKSNEPDQSPVGVFEISPAGGIKRQRPIPIQLAGELQRAQRQYVAWIRRERCSSHLDPWYLARTAAVRLRPDRAIRGEFRQTVGGFRPQRCGIVRNCGLACLFDARHSPVQRRDQLLELACERLRGHRHRWPPLDPVPRREAFQISPQLTHRQ